jgi:hypothetical protein
MNRSCYIDPFHGPRHATVIRLRRTNRIDLVRMMPLDEGIKR